MAPPMESIFDQITTPSVSCGAKPASSEAGGAKPVFQGMTGLVAALSAEEFEQIVRDAMDPVVLKTIMRSPSGQDKKKTVTLYRYVLSCSGIVFVTTSGHALMFSSSVREVNCLAVMHDGKPLGRDQSVFQG